jgi:hypothetical protein|tara:strand:+ start:9884 stop:10114 length:231 start_codon:yes stop_codon:yes gene_type:complete
MSSLESFSNSIQSGPIPWREQSDLNRAAWIEACEGVNNGIPARRAARWLIEEKGCPLMLDTVRNQIKSTMKRYVKS